MPKYAQPTHRGITQPPIQREVYFRFLGDETMGAGYHVGLPEMRTMATDVVRPEYSISYILKGGGTFTDEVCPRQEFAPGMAIQRFPDRRYSIHRYEHLAQAEFCLILPRSVYEALLKTGVVSPTRAILNVGADPLLHDRMRGFVDQMKSGNDDPFLLMDALDLLNAILRRAAAGVPDQPAAWVQQACALLQDSTHSDLSQRDIAAHLGVGYETFRKTFRKQVGIAPKDYRRRKQFEHAVDLLINRRWEIQQIADELGYADIPAFARQFAKVVGLPPGQFRARHEER